VRYRRAVEKLQELARACERVKDWPPEDPFLVSAYVFGDALDGADPLEAVQVAVAVNLPPEEVPWGSSPHGTGWLADQLRLSKGGFEYWWRSHLDPAWNHYIRGPVRFWSHDGPDEAVLAALAERRLAGLPRLEPSPDMAREQLAGDLDAALRHLRQVRDCYWEHDWRKEHRGSGRYPEHELWEAVEGYLDILDATHPPSPGPAPVS
jgi:hypothetical protein